VRAVRTRADAPFQTWLHSGTPTGVLTTPTKAIGTVANIKSQIKRNRTNEAARLRNKSTKSALKTAVRKFHAAADSGDAAQVEELARQATRALDKAASKGVIHKNQAANRKSAIATRAAAVAKA
jgi:small subunit ribosomal protein S20